MARVLLSLIFFNFCALVATAQTTDADPKSVYEKIKAFELSGGRAEVASLVLKRDRVTMRFSGTFYFAAAVDGRVTGAVFLGQGLFRAEPPPSAFEAASVKQILGADVVESDFRSAVLRFSDDTFALIGKNRVEGDPVDEARKLAFEINPQILRETGANIASRLTLSIVNGESPGVFFGSFDGGKLGRFNHIFDPQNRLPTQFFVINGGEKGLIFAYEGRFVGTEVWMAFHALSDYEKNRVEYSDVNDLIDIESYKINADLRNPKTRLALRCKIAVRSKMAGIRAITLTLGRSRVEIDHQLRVKSLTMGGSRLNWVQEDWERGLTAFLPAPAGANEQFVLEIEIGGDFILQPPGLETAHYPRSNASWFPSHGYLDRATFDLTFVHPSGYRIAANGIRLEEAVSPDDKDSMVTRYVMNQPVSFVTFAMAPFKRFTASIKWENGDPPIPLEYNSLTFVPISEEFILAELSNSIRFFHRLFGRYPYENYAATFHPFPFGQGFPGMLMIPNFVLEDPFAFIAHETSHQWWGNIVAWRSYRDQWLSEGFAEYCGVLYTSSRLNPKAAAHLVEKMRDLLRQPPKTRNGIGSGHVWELGPIVLGHRLNTHVGSGAYQSLVYSKGALVLRMLHFLFTDPETGSSDAFFKMMRDFVERYRGKAASTEDFRIVSGAHFSRTPIARQLGLPNLDWFFWQWVYESDMPSYSLEYAVEDQPDGSAVIRGIVSQQDVPDDWAMILPVVVEVPGKKVSYSPVLVMGAKREFRIAVPTRPKRVELDPDRWILSDKTTTKN